MATTLEMITFQSQPICVVLFPIHSHGHGEMHRRGLLSLHLPPCITRQIYIPDYGSTPYSLAYCIKLCCERNKVDRLNVARLSRATSIVRIVSSGGRRGGKKGRNPLEVHVRTVVERAEGEECSTMET